MTTKLQVFVFNQKKDLDKNSQNQKFKKKPKLNFIYGENFLCQYCHADINRADIDKHVVSKEHINI